MFAAGSRIFDKIEGFSLLQVYLVWQNWISYEGDYFKCECFTVLRESFFIDN